MEFEQLLLGQLVTNSTFSSKVLHYIQDVWFEHDSSNVIFNITKDHIQQYNSLPATEAIILELEQLPVSEDVFNDSVECIKTLDDKKDYDLQWLVDKAEIWAQQRAAHVALTKCIEIQGGESKELDPMAMPEIMKEAVSISFNTDLGHRYFEDSEKFYDNYYSIPDKRYPFTIKELNRLTKGGSADGTLNVVLAGINVGKSMWLIDLMCVRALQGKNCVYFTLEMSEDVCRERCDVRMLDIVFGDAENMSKEEYLSKLNHIKQFAGEIYIKDYPSGSAGTQIFRNYMKEVKLKDNVEFDWCAIDYITLMKSDWLPDKMRGNTNTYFGSVATELRGFYTI